MGRLESLMRRGDEGRPFKGIKFELRYNSRKGVMQ